MADEDDDLPVGLYERLITRALDARLLRFDPTRTRVVRERVEPAEAHQTLSRHVERVVAQALRGLPEADRLERQAEIANQVIALISSGGPFANTRAAARAGNDVVHEGRAAFGTVTAEGAPDVTHHEGPNDVVVPPEELRAIRDLAGGAALDVEMPSPLVPLSASDLLVNARGEPGLAQNLAAEIPSADSIDLLCAFVRWHGLRVLEGPLRAHCRARKPLRVITTVYTGSTERKALDWLVSLGAEVRVSYDTQSTRLHAKAWLFRRATGYSTAYIGSSNLSKSALLDGVEWNVRLSEVGSPDVLEKFDATFATYWASPEYERYEPARDGIRLDAELARAGGAGTPQTDTPLTLLEVTPWPHQSEMLERLMVERNRHDRHRNLIVAATGTGKTIVSALDFKQLRRQMGDPSLLFVAHRQEILRQSLGAFRQVLRSGDFGELYVDGHRPDEWRHVFASVQSLAQLDLNNLNPAAFDVVIVDEFHHAAAPTYRRLLEHLQPKELVGLTATPERTDGESVLSFFDDHISVELRLWDALERGLLCPFQYFGLNDETDISAVQWSRTGYDVAELERLYTADDARLRLVLRQVAEKLRDPASMHALGFCVSIAHAEFMARRFSEAGLASLAVSANTDSAARRQALRDLEAGHVRALFAVDIFNEGVDLPAVDTLLFLRPTESAVVFMQQLGRGLRRSEGKDCVTVLDFIGKANRRFRFDLRYRAVTGTSRRELEQQVADGFPFLPAGCTMQLDRVARGIVLDSLREAIPSSRPAMVRELRALLDARRNSGTTGIAGAVPDISLSEFLSESGLELEDVYRSGCWSALQRSAGMTVPAAGPDETDLGRALGRMLHIDDPLRLAAYHGWLTADTPTPADDSSARLLTGLHFTLYGRQAPDTLEETWRRLRAHPAILSEVLELLALLDQRAEHLTYPLNSEMGWSYDVPLSVHARHSLIEVMAAFGRAAPGRHYQHREGTLRDETTSSDLFFVTLEKLERHYSPTTLYRDYAVSPDLFHWESQSTTTQASPTGQRYIRHRELGCHPLLFVRQRKKAGSATVPYTMLGPATYVSHKGERPISFVWRLQRPMPADFFRDAKVAAG